MTNGRFLGLLLAAIAVGGGCTDSISGKGGTPATPPAAPTNLAGLVQSGKTLSLSWGDASGNETGFRVEVNTSPFGTPPYAGVFFVGANATGYDYVASQPNTAYYFRVYAITGSMQSDPSNEITLNTANFPLPPYYVTALATGPNSVDVRWYNGPSVVGNSLEWSTDGATWTQIFNNMTGPNQTVGAGHSGLTPDTVYYYRAFATNASGVSDPSIVAEIRTQSNFVNLTTVPSGSGFGFNSSLAFGPSANQNIVSYDQWAQNLVITRGGYPGPYSTFTIDTGQGNGYYGCSAATDNAGNVFVASHVYWDDQLRFITNQTGPWTAVTLDSDPMFTVAIYGKEPLIKVSPANQSIHILYKQENSQTGDGWIRHRWRANAVGSGWNYEDVLGPVAVLRGQSFAIDNAGTLHLVYATQNLGTGEYEMRHAWNSGGGWNDELIAAGGMPSMNSVTVGASNRLHVAYKDASGSGSLWYATNRSGSWEAELVHVHTTDNIGLYNSIVYFPTGAADVHISYYEVKFGNLWYAGKSGANGPWTRKLLDSVGDVGRYTSIGTDGADLYISYYDFTNSKLKIVQNPQD
jgi:hypothetical protein